LEKTKVECRLDREMLDWRFPVVFDEDILAIEAQSFVRDFSGGNLDWQ